MAALVSNIIRRSLGRYFFTTSADPLLDSPSFAQRLRDLPKALPGTKIKSEVSQVTDYNSLVFVIRNFHNLVLVVIFSSLNILVLCFVRLIFCILEPLIAVGM